MHSSNSTSVPEHATAVSLTLPADVVALCRRLQEAGWSAFVVGGAVRDLLRRSMNDSQADAKDFDVATAAPPEEVVKLFGPRRTIPTGIAHGTVTVLSDRQPKDPADPRPRHIEVTTFRGETGYSDGRRPDRVQFIDDLTEDLRRRDFTINAIAYDPISGLLRDPFDGRGALERRIIRAVGDATQRFAEDGLRLLRAVRFAAKLGFTIDAATRAAFSAALPTLRKVSRERVRDELLRLVAAAKPSLGLRDMIEPTIESLLGVALPEVATAITKSAAAPQRFLALVDRAPAEQRLAALLWPMRAAVAGQAVRDLSNRLDDLLKLPAKDRQHLAALLTFPRIDYQRESPWTAAALRRFMARHSKELIDDFLTLCRLELRINETREDEVAASVLDELAQRIAAERTQNPPLSMGDLALTGKELMAELGLSPGPAVGETLRQLLEYVLDDPRRNERQGLLSEAARQRTAALPGSS